MSAECNKCGTDLVHSDEWPDMFCQVCDLRQQRDALRAALEETADFLETTAATAARRDEPEMARILSNVSYKTRQALKGLKSPRAEDYTPGPGDFGLEEK